MGGSNDADLGTHSRDVVWSFTKEPAIVSRLLTDGRASLSVLAKDMGDDAYRQKAWRRLKDLEGDAIWGYTAVVDERRLGWSEYMVTFQLDSLTEEHLDALIGAVGELASDANVRLQDLHATTDSEAHFVGRLSARTALAARRAIQAIQSAAPEAFAAEPKLIELMGAVVKGGQTNPDTEFLGHLRDEWVR